MPSSSTESSTAAPFCRARTVMVFAAACRTALFTASCAAGIGVSVARAGEFSLRAYLAAKTTDEAATSDIDRSSRAWVQAAVFF